MFSLLFGQDSYTSITLGRVKEQDDVDVFEFPSELINRNSSKTFIINEWLLKALINTHLTTVLWIQNANNSAGARVIPEV